MARVLAPRQRRAESVTGVIDDYVIQLRAALRVPADEIIAEVDDHLRESAARVGEAAAIDRFGPVDVVAARFHRDALERAGRGSIRAVVVAGAVLFTVFLATDLVQPAAPWLDRATPIGLQWKLQTAMLLAQVAVVSGVVAFLHRVRRHHLAAIQAAVVTLVAGAGAFVLHAAFQLDRLGRVHTSSAVAATTIAGIAARAIVLVAAGVAVVRAERRARSLSDQPEPGRLIRQRTGWILCVALAVLAGFAVFGHDEATRVRSVIDGGIEAAAVVAAYALLRTRLGLAGPAADAAYTARRIPR